MEQSKKIVGLEMNLDQEYLKGAVEDIVKAGISQALGDPSEIVAKAVNHIINMSVDADGKPVSNDSYRAKPYLKWYAEQVITKTVKECLEKYVEENRIGFEEEIMKQLGKKKFKADTASAFVQAMISNASSRYSMPITIEFTPDKERY